MNFQMEIVEVTNSWQTYDKAEVLLNQAPGATPIRTRLKSDENPELHIGK
jgi:hypothetical protein